MALVKGPYIVFGECTLKRFPDRFGDHAATAHASQELDQRVPRLKSLGAQELEDMRNAAKDPYGVLNLHTRRLGDLVYPIFIPLIHVLDEPDISGGSKLEEVP